MHRAWCLCRDQTRMPRYLANFPVHHLHRTTFQPSEEGLCKAVLVTAQSGSVFCKTASQPCCVITSISGALRTLSLNTQQLSVQRELLCIKRASLYSSPKEPLTCWTSSMTGRRNSTAHTTDTSRLVQPCGCIDDCTPCPHELSTQTHRRYLSCQRQRR